MTAPQLKWVTLNQWYLYIHLAFPIPANGIFDHCTIYDTSLSYTNILCQIFHCSSHYIIGLKSLFICLPPQVMLAQARTIYC